MISVHFQGKPFSITVSQVYAPTTNAEEAEVERFYEDQHDLLEPTPKKDTLFIILLLLSHFSCVRLCATPWTAAHQAPLSLGFSRQEYWSGVPLPSLPFHHRGLECKSRKSRDIWTNSKFGLRVQNEAGQRLTQSCQENPLVIANPLF